MGEITHDGAKFRTYELLKVVRSHVNREYFVSIFSESLSHASPRIFFILFIKLQVVSPKDKKKERLVAPPSFMIKSLLF